MNKKLIIPIMFTIFCGAIAILAMTQEVQTHTVLENENTIQTEPETGMQNEPILESEHKKTASTTQTSDETISESSEEVSSEDIVSPWKQPEEMRKFLETRPKEILDVVSFEEIDIPQGYDVSKLNKYLTDGGTYFQADLRHLLYAKVGDRKTIILDGHEYTGVIEEHEISGDTSRKLRLNLGNGQFLESTEDENVTDLDTLSSYESWFFSFHLDLSSRPNETSYFTFTLTSDGKFQGEAYTSEYGFDRSFEMVEGVGVYMDRDEYNYKWSLENTLDWESDDTEEEDY